MADPKSRPLGGTEHGWCRATRGGTGNSVLSLLLSKSLDISTLQNALNRLQNSHPILRSKLHLNSSSNTFTFITSSTPTVQVKTVNLSSCIILLQNLSKQNHNFFTPFHLLHEHELNQDVWSDPNQLSTPKDVFFATLYVLPNTEQYSVLVLLLHLSACDRSSAVSMLRELQDLIKEEQGGGAVESRETSTGEIGLPIEELIPAKKSSKSMWARGMDMLSYSVNAFKLANLKFQETKSPRRSQVVRLQLSAADTGKLLAGCKARGIKLCSVLQASGLIAVYNSNTNTNSNSRKQPEFQRKTFGVATLVDCRSLLHPPLTYHHLGFYHSAILHLHVLKGGETLWDLAAKTYSSFETLKNKNKHFSDMADLNFLMCKAMDNPGLTPSSSLRTSLMSVFEDTVIDESSSHKRRDGGIEDYMSCASVHGIGPSMAVFDTIRDGALDCVCVYPSPLHSREQMEDLVNQIKTVLAEAASVAP